MNLFCFSLEVSNFENGKTKRKSIRRSMSESKVFEGKTVNDTIWQEPSKSENDSHIRRLSQLKDLNEDDFLSSHNAHTLQGKKLQGISYQTVKSGDDPVESIGTLKRLQKLVWIKKARVPSLNEMKPTSINLQDEDETLISCMKLAKSQEKKVNVNTRGKEGMEIRLDSISASLVRSSASTRCSLAEMLSHNEGEVQMWNNWKPFPENPLWTYVDFQIDQTGLWDNCFHCTHHPRLKSSCTDMDLPQSWCIGEGNGTPQQYSCLENPMDGGAWWAAVHGVAKIKHFGFCKNMIPNKVCNIQCRNLKFESTQSTVKYVNKYLNGLKGTRSSSFGNFDRFWNNSTAKPDDSTGVSIPFHFYECYTNIMKNYEANITFANYSGITSCSDGTSNRDSFRLDDDGLYSGPFCGRARVHTDFTPSPYDTDSLKIKKGDIIDIICKTPMGMWTGMLNNKVGNFKFIYVDVISEEAAPKKMKTQRRSGMEKPETLQEFLERIHLQEYTSTLLLNGYETLEDLKDIKESHLIELNIKNPEDRMRLLSAAENLLDEETIQEQESESMPLSLSPDILNKSQLDDCPRDSGCYISSENSDNGCKGSSLELQCCLATYKAPSDEGPIQRVHLDNRLSNDLPVILSCQKAKLTHSIFSSEEGLQFLHNLTSKEQLLGMDPIYITAEVRKEEISRSQTRLWPRLREPRADRKQNIVGPGSVHNFRAQGCPTQASLSMPCASSPLLLPLSRVSHV
ncbi:hypothetical protein MG293_000874 [Ovis ammon polii]|uniref:SAM domain-containing protein SAMSN-1 n=1 Tax=Ovis ammon polii TaxID=230172 RepID=A0AAD4YHI1_OVIAM|nr:hypothetical protein MG293_000874 [Ovis ammon polii]